MSWTSAITLAPPDAVFGVAEAFQRDPSPDKINLGVGAYRDERGAPFVLPSVRRAEQLIQEGNHNHEYLPQTGLPELRRLAPTVLFGESAEVLPRVACVQALSGTGALRVAGEFLREFHPPATVFVTEPTWSNHTTIFQKCGFKVGQLRYFDEATRGLAFAAFLDDVEGAPEGSILVLHTCAHNPTGVDPTPAQWQAVEQAVARRRHTVLFDTAYQGYASGSLERDAWALRHFVGRGHEVVVCQSFAKNMGLYGERVGTVSVVCREAAAVPAVESRLEKVIRPMYSNPPKHGALVAATVLGSPQLRAQWLSELVEMSSRILATRAALVAELQRLDTPGTWTHITSQIGMFSYTGLSAPQVDILTRRHHIYLLSSGRISMAGINQSNVARLAAAIDDAVRSTAPKL